MLPNFDGFPVKGSTTPTLIGDSSGAAIAPVVPAIRNIATVKLKNTAIFFI
jgi:hypothetical protein